MIDYKKEIKLKLKGKKSATGSDLVKIQWNSLKKEFFLLFDNEEKPLLVFEPNRGKIQNPIKESYSIIDIKMTRNQKKVYYIEWGRVYIRNGNRHFLDCQKTTTLARLWILCYCRQGRRGLVSQFNVQWSLQNEYDLRTNKKIGL